MLSRSIFRFFALVATLVLSFAAGAQSYPSKSLRIVVPFGAGGVADLTARTVAQKMSESLGQSVVIDNRPGAGGIVAAEMVAKSEPDGYTLLLMSNANAVSAGLFKVLPFDPLKDFTPVSLMGTFDLAIVTSASASEYEERCLQAGADVFIEKSSSPTQIIAALRSLLITEDESGEEAATTAGPTKLSKRQKQLILMLDQGLSNRDIAEKLNISEHTVKVHFWRLFRRLGVNSRTQALHFARTNGWLGI